jgi:hypothetical protein
MRTRSCIAIITAVSLVGFLSCEEIIPAAPADDEILDGPVQGLSGAEQRQFLAGDIAFNDEIFTVENGFRPPIRCYLMRQLPCR